jgi:uncharacterized membrane protein YgdD (TMEM256/DUF423 family)
MAESFLLLLAAGVMLATAVPNPKDVTLNWLRLGGIIALALTGLSYYFARAVPTSSPILTFRHAIIAALILIQLALAQLALRNTQRLFALAAFAAGVWLTAHSYNFAHSLQPFALPDRADVLRARATSYLTSAGVAAVTGIALMDMLLGHAYLTASKMTITPFRRLNASLIAGFALRIVCALGLVLALHTYRPVPALWPVHGLLVATRWAVGLLIPFIFILMAHDCIKRRSTQSATGILYVAGVLIFVGELLALHLARETALPF